MNCFRSLRPSLFAAGDPVPASRIALVTGEQTQTIISAAKDLAAAYEENRCGMRLVQMNDLLQLCSAPEYADYIRRTLEQRKPPKLSQPALDGAGRSRHISSRSRAHMSIRCAAWTAPTRSRHCSSAGSLSPAASSMHPGRPSLYRTSALFFAHHGYAVARRAACAARICRPMRARKSSNRPSRSCAAAANRWS